MADEHYLYNISGGETSSIKDGDTTNPILYEPGDGTGTKEATVTAGDYVDWVDYYQHDDPIVPSFMDRPLYVYTLNSDWKYVGQMSTGYEWGTYGCNVYTNCCGSDAYLKDVPKNEVEGSTVDEVVIEAEPSGEPEYDYYYIEEFDGTGGFKYYGCNPDAFGFDNPTHKYYEPVTVKATYGDLLSVRYDHTNYDYIYQYPGVWVAANQYPDLTINPEPKYKGHVQLKWTDPPDITDWKPTPATWEGTVIVRKENSAPLHRWDGDKVVRTTTRDKYKSKPYKDEDIETNKVYYYAFMPYYTKIDDPQHPIRYYTFTKCIRVETGTISYIPEIIKIDMNEDVATITYAITLPATGPYDTAKLYGKKDGNPACDNTDDIVEDISQVDDQIVVPDIDGDYYFCIQVANGTDTLTSDVVSCSGEAVIPIPEDYKFIEDINALYIHNTNFVVDQQGIGGTWKLSGQIEFLTKNFSFVNNDEHLGFSGGTYGGYYKENYRRIPMDGGGTTFFYPTTPITITVTSTENSVTVSYSNYSIIALGDFLTAAISEPFTTENTLRMRWSSGSECTQSTETIFTPNQTSFANLSEALHYVYKFYSNVKIIVNGSIWIKRAT